MGRRAEGSGRPARIRPVGSSLKQGLSLAGSLPDLKAWGQSLCRICVRPPGSQSPALWARVAVTVARC
jgi:hypothetical protein